MPSLMVLKRIEFEKATVETMILTYCRHHHRSKELCCECSSLRDYAFVRIEKCPLRPDKPVCAACKIHCYKSSMRERIRVIMRYSGPRMIYLSPLKAISYILIKKKLIFR